MKLVRTFHPVGHGAFYTERFWDDSHNNPHNVANFIYDCGSNTLPQVSLRNLIAQEFANGSKEIDAVFISHFHDDHINGLFNLCHICNVHKIIVPLLPNDYKVWTLLYNALRYGAASIGNRVLMGDFANDNLFREEETVYIENDCIIPILPHAQYHSLWEYKAYRLPNYSKTFCSRYNQLLHALQRDPLFSSAFVNGNIDYRLLYSLLTQAPNILILKNILKSAHIRLCDNSYNLIVSSQRTYSIGQPLLSYLGCLYTGDAELMSIKKMANLQSHFNLDNWNYSIIQVPHHGATSNNHNCALYDKNQECIISAQENDKKHPTRKVFNDIASKNGNALIITENPSTQQTYTYTQI